MKSSDSWFTPPWLIDWAHQVLGGRPDFDPASCAKANANVRARRYDYLVEDDDGDLRVARMDSDDGDLRVARMDPELRIFELSPIVFPLDARTTFMNPPFSRAKEFTRRLVDWAEVCPTDKRFFAILPANANSAYFLGLVGKYHVFLPAKRVAFVNGETGEVGTAPRGNIAIVVHYPFSRPPEAPVEGVWIREAI
jgi:hypothetical protein